ncbi:MAG: arylsulfatase, partial [Chloroflexi bacterium]|nr:arylsulfatase [Chloroflexota bacterium]
RVQQWKVNFLEQRGLGIAAWEEPFVRLRLPQLYNLRSDPFERANESIFYGKWKADRLFVLVPAQAIVGMFLQTFEEFPPRQRPSSFSIDEALQKARENHKALTEGAVKD